MAEDLIINLSLLISLLSISGIIFKENPMNASIKNQIVGGLVMATLGVVLMYFSISINEDVRIDLRNFAIIIAAIYGGPISLIISTIIIALSRIAIFGVNDASITALFTFLFLSIFCFYIRNRKSTPKRKFFFMNIASIIVTSFALIYLLNDVALRNSVIFQYLVISTVGGYAAYQIANYVYLSNENYRMLKQFSQKDSLTGLNNVRQFNQVWEESFKTARENKEELSFLLLDIDHFKKVNDTYGHHSGDIVLKEVSQILIDTTRSDDFVARNGGEEFSVILPKCSKEQALDIAERIRKKIEQHIFTITNNKKIKVTASIGMSNFTYQNINREELKELADKNLYKAKNNGRNQVYS